MAQQLHPTQKIILSTTLVATLLALTSVTQATSAADVYGIADSYGNIVKQPSYHCLQYLKPKCFMAADNDPVGKINAGGNEFSIVHDRPFPKIASGGLGKRWLNEQLVAFELDGKQGVCDDTGHIILEPKFSELGYAGDGIVCATDFADANFPCKFYDSKGQYLFQSTRREYHGQQFSEGLLCLGSWGDRVFYCDTKGKEKIVGALTSGEPFHDGLAAVTIATREITGAGYIDHNGDMKVGPFKNAAVQKFEDGYGVVTFYDYDFGGQSSPRCGVTDLSGNLVIPAVYDSIHRFSKSYFVVHKDSRFLLTDTAGGVIFNFPIDCNKVMETHSDATEQLIPYAVQESTEVEQPYENKEGVLKWGFCDMHGTTRIAPKYQLVEPFEHGLAPVYEFVNGNTNNRAGLIKADGSFKLPDTYTGMHRCPDGNYIVYQSDGTEQTVQDIAYDKRPEIAFPKALREHDLIGISKEELVGLLGVGEASKYKRSGIPDAIKETTQYALYAGGFHCGNGSHWLEFGFDAAGKVYGWRNIGFQWEGKWCRENVVFPENCTRFSLTEALPKKEHSARF